MSTPPRTGPSPSSSGANSAASSSGGGLSHSSPLVTIPAAPPVGIIRPPLPADVSSAVHIEHPLAMASSASSSAEVQASSSRVLPAPPPHYNTAASSSIAATPIPLLQPPPSSATTSLDDLANLFLSTRSPRTEELGLDPILGPVALPPKIDALHRLQHLVQRRAWGDVHLLGEQLLNGSNTASHIAPIYTALLRHYEHDELGLDSHKSELVWVMTIHLRALIKLKYYNKLKAQIESWTFCYHHHHDENKSPKWIPWNLHIMAAACLFYTTSAAAAIDELWNIRSCIHKMDGIALTQSIAILQVESALINVFLAEKQWRMALECLERIMDISVESNAVAVVCQEELKRHKSKLHPVVLLAACHSEVLSRQGRILLQAGALNEADEIFQRALSRWELECHRIDWNYVHNLLAIQIVPVQLEVNQGLLCFSYAKYDEALQYFGKAVSLLRVLQKEQLASPEPLSRQLLADDWIENSNKMTPVLLLGDDISSRKYISSLYSETVNNMALCALYTCRLADALNIMESLVRQDPTAYLTERVTLNLCTLYELGSETNDSTRKKKILQIIAKRFFLHDIGPECFRVA